MRKFDPFLALLGDALAAPELELDADSRAHLLAEAGKAPPPGVVPLVTEETWQVAAFNWLVGEQPTDAALLDRLTRDLPFATNVTGQLSFLRQLRWALRPDTSVTRSGPDRTAVRKSGLKRMITAGIAAAIAWMLVMTAPSGFSGGSSSSRTASTSLNASDGNSPAKEKEPASHSGRSERQVQGFAEISAESRQGREDWPRPNVESVRKGADLLEFPEATQLAAKELFSGSSDGFASALFSSDPGVESLVAFVDGTPGSYFQGEGGAEWLLAQQLLSTGQAFHANLGEKAVPEPSGLLLAAAGSLALLARRRRPPASSLTEFRETRLPPRRFYGRRFPAE